MWMVVFLLVGFWGLGFVNGYSFGGLIHILLVYAGLMVIARLIERHRTPVEPFELDKPRKA